MPIATAGAPSRSDVVLPGRYRWPAAIVLAGLLLTARREDDAALGAGVVLIGVGLVLATRAC